MESSLTFTLFVILLAFIFEFTNGFHDAAISIATIVINRYFDLENLPVDPTVIRVIRIIRIARVLKLLKTAKGIQSLLNTVGESMLQVGNLALLFGLFFFIFSTLGVEIFGKLRK